MCLDFCDEVFCESIHGVDTTIRRDGEGTNMRDEARRQGTLLNNIKLPKLDR